MSSFCYPGKGPAYLPFSERADRKVPPWRDREAPGGEASLATEEMDRKLYAAFSGN